MKYCSHCAHELVTRIPPMDNMPRRVCPACGMVFYRNPKLVVCTIPVLETKEGSRILLCKRAIEPRMYYWTLPGGFMEIGETTSGAAYRETMEEAGADTEIGMLHSMINLPRWEQVHLFYLAKMKNDRLDPGEETLEARFFAEDEIPWDSLAFSTIRNALRFYFGDKNERGGRFEFHALDMPL